MTTQNTLFERLKKGEAIAFADPDYGQIGQAVRETRPLLVALNNAVDDAQIRQLLSQIIGAPVAENTMLFPPFFTNYGKHIKLGRNVFINHACSFLDLGGITIEDNVMIGPGVSLSSESHGVSLKDRRTLVPGHIHVKENAWIGAKATILPGVTIGKKSIVAAAAVVCKDVPDNTVVAGVPAAIVKSIE